MLWFRQTPFLAVVVFGIGVGLGLAWKSGWIPVEVGSANTGTLSDGESDYASVSSDLSTSLTPTTGGAAPAELPPDAPTLFPQAEPEAPPERLDRTVRPIARPIVRSAANHERAVPAVREELEWAAEPPGKSAVRNQTEAILPRFADAKRRDSKEIRLVSNQDPPPRSTGESSTEPSPSASSLAEDLKTVDEQIANNDILPAHRTLSKLYWSHKEARNELMPRLEQTAKAIFFEPHPHFVDPYVVQPNDKLSAIASKYQLSWEYVRKLNRIDPRRIQSGQKLKILKGPFAAVVDLNEFALTIHMQGYYVRRYPVGIGKDGASPVGKFAVLNKIENPQYTGPDGRVISGDDPANPLGERWIDLGDSYGIHGTIEPDSIGKAASRGCIRMREKDVIEVYDFLVKGSEVVIRK